MADMSALLPLGAVASYRSVVGGSIACASQCTQAGTTAWSGKACPRAWPGGWKPAFPRDKRGTRLRGGHAQTKSQSMMSVPP